VFVLHFLDDKLLDFCGFHWSKQLWMQAFMVTVPLIVAAEHGAGP
jgi:hypothetical protein